MCLRAKFILAFCLAFFNVEKGTAAQRLATNAEWWYSACRGGRLVQAMVWSPPQANEFLDPISSPWDGAMHQELAQWGYTESEKPQLCEFDTYWGLGSAFRSLGIDARSNVNQGPNRCFHVSHGDPTLKRPDGSQLPFSEQTYVDPDGRTRRVTGAFSNIGINPDAGVVYFISRKSPGESAQMLWQQNPLPRKELPALRSSADFAWAFWNRMPHNTQITAFWCLSVNNRETLSILNLAFKTYRPPPGHQKVNSIQEWPGTNFDITSVEAVAILGSPIGIAAGFFLAQHKRQLGGNKMISMITVFKARQPVTDDEFPTLIFWVKDARNIYGYGDGDIDVAQWANVSNVLRRSADGKSLLREHVIRVRL